MNSLQETPAGPSLEKGFQLDGLRIDPLGGEVAGPGGREKLDPKVMDVLVLMARHAGQVVSRDDLLSKLWPNAIVTDDALTRCFYELRRQLSRAGGNERYKAMIETLPKRGYRLNGAITQLHPSSQPVPDALPAVASKRRRIVIAVSAAVAIALLMLIYWRVADSPAKPGSLSRVAVPSIAVLPFIDMSAAQDQQYFADGIADDILNRLSAMSQLRVIARTSSFSFRGKAVDIPQIADKLDVTHVLEGSVRRSGTRVRITAQLIDASSNSHLWSETYDREFGDVFAIQDEISAAVAAELRVTLARAQSPGDVPTSAAAYEQFLRGQFFYDRRAPGDVELAAKYYLESLAIEPTNARAWAALAGAYSLLTYEKRIAADVGLAKQGEAARKAVELDPSLAVGQARLAQYYWDTGDRKTSYRIFDQALALDADDPLVLTLAAGIAMRNGDADGAIERYRRIIARDPLSASHHANMGIYLLAVGRLDEAKAELLKALELNPNFGWGLELQIARILILQGRLEEAASIIKVLPEGEARDHGHALLFHALGQRPEADAALKRLVARSAATPDIRLAEVYAFRGMIEKSFSALDGIQEAVERNEASTASQLWSWQLELRVSPFLKPLHADPRWDALLVEPRS